MLFCCVYILDLCKNVDCGLGFKCELVERFYSCKGKVEVCLKFENYIIFFEFFD